MHSIVLVPSGSASTNRITSVISGSTTLNCTYDANGNVINDGLHSYRKASKAKNKFPTGDRVHR